MDAQYSSDYDLEDDASVTFAESSSHGGGCGSGTPEIGFEESKLVRGSKRLVIVVLGLATCLCAVGAYWFSKQSDHESFKAQVSTTTS